MNKLGVCLIVAFLLSSVSVLAFEFDNVKDNFNAEENSIDIINSFGLGSTLATIKLVENSDQALINGRAVFEITLPSNYNDGITDGVKFYDKLNRETTARDVKWRYLTDVERTRTVYTYREQCIVNQTSDGIDCNQVVDTVTEEDYIDKDWVEYTGQNVAAGTHLFELTAKKNRPTYSVDFVPTLLGVELPEFAWWDSNWQRKRQFNVTENSDAALTDYTIRFNVTFDPEMNADFSDVRWLNTDENVELGFFFSEIHASDHAIVWILVDSLPASTTTPIYMYYNNSDATTSTSNISLAFLDAELNRTVNTPDSIQPFGNTLYGVNTSLVGQINWSNSSGDKQATWGYNDTQIGSAINIQAIRYWNDGSLPFSTAENLQTLHNNDTSSNIEHANFNTTLLLGQGNTFGWGTYEISRYSQNTSFSVDYKNYHNSTVGNVSDQNIVIFYGAKSICTVLSCSSYELNWSGIRNAVFPEPTITNSSNETFEGEGGVVLVVPEANSIQSGINVNFTCTGSVTGNSALNITNITIKSYFPDNTLLFENDTNFTGRNISVTADHYVNISGEFVGNERFNYTCYMCLEDNQCSYNSLNVTGSDANLTYFVDNGVPQIFIDEPALEGNITNISLIFNVTDPSIGSCFYSINGGVNVSHDCSNNATTIAINASGANNLTFYANDTQGNLNSTVKPFLVIDRIREGFNAVTLGTAQERINITLQDLTSEIITVNLLYDGNTFFGNLVATDGSNRTYEAIVDILPNASGNFNWTVSAVVDGFGETHTYPSQSQEVNNITIVPTTDGSTCDNPSAKIYTLNFTFVDETTGLENDTGFNLTTFYNVWVTSPANSLNFTWTEAHPGEASYPVCIFPNYTIANATFKLIYGGEGGFTEREFNLQSHTINNETQNFTLLLLNDTIATTVTINVKDSNGLDLNGFLVKAFLQNLGNATVPFILVDSQVTDLNGQVVMELDTSNYFQFEILKDGVLVHTEPPFIIQQPEFTIIVPTDTLLDVQIATDLVSGLSPGINYNNLTGNVTATWNDVGNIAGNVCLRTDNLSANTINAFSFACSTADSGSLVQQIGNSSNMHFIATLYAESNIDQNTYAIASLEILLTNRIGIFGTEGVYWALISIPTLALLVAGSISTAIIVAIAVLGIFGPLLGFISLSWFFFAGIMLVGGMILILLQD